jgi:hypothetical protein
MESLMVVKKMRRTAASVEATTQHGVNLDKQDTAARHLRRLYEKKHGSSRKQRPRTKGPPIHPGLGVLYGVLEKQLAILDQQLRQPISEKRRRELETVRSTIAASLQRRLTALRTTPRADLELQVQEDVLDLNEISPWSLIVQERQKVEELLAIARNAGRST